MTPAPGPGAVVIFKRSFVAAHSPSHDRLCLAVRAMLLRLTLTRHRSAPVPSTSLCDVRGQRGRRAAPPDIRQQTDRRTDGTLVIMYIDISRSLIDTNDRFTPPCAHAQRGVYITTVIWFYFVLHLISYAAVRTVK